MVWDDRFRDYDFGPEHPFSENSRWLAVRLLETTGFFARGSPSPGPLRRERVEVADDETLLRFHEPAYLERVRSVGSSDRPGLLDRGDTPGFVGCHDAAARIAQGTLDGLAEVLGSPGHHAINPAGGLHHAHPGRASGFCIYDDVALAIATALDGPARLRRVAYVDIDAHHGDGVMYGFYDDGRVLDIDFHQDGRTLFPGTGAIDEVGRGDGEGLKVNLPLPPTAGDEAIVPLFDRVVPPLLREYRPELIVLQTGVDGHAGDPLARLQYSDRSYLHVVGALHDLVHELGHGRLLETGGGGYRASSVARVLASAARRLRGPCPADRPEEVTPVSWRSEFEAATGEAAPRDWSDPEPVVGSIWTPESEDRLVRGLERGLGRRFGGRIAPTSGGSP